MPAKATRPARTNGVRAASSSLATCSVTSSGASSRPGLVSVSTRDAQLTEVPSKPYLKCRLDVIDPASTCPLAMAMPQTGPDGDDKDCKEAVFSCSMIRNAQSTASWAWPGCSNGTPQAAQPP